MGMSRRLSRPLLARVLLAAEMCSQEVSGGELEAYPPCRPCRLVFHSPHSARSSRPSRAASPPTAYHTTAPSPSPPLRCRRACRGAPHRSAGKDRLGGAGVRAEGGKESQGRAQVWWSGRSPSAGDAYRLQPVQPKGPFCLHPLRLLALFSHRYQGRQYPIAWAHRFPHPPIPLLQTRVRDPAWVRAGQHASARGHTHRPRLSRARLLQP